MSKPWRGGVLWAGVAMAVFATGCSRRAAPSAARPHYVVGSGYQAGGVWFYPREDFHYAATGLAVVQPDDKGVTADGEVVDPSALTASHHTLQLPAIARVTNLDTGLQVAVRVNDRGPNPPRRLLGLSRRAGELLGIPIGAAAPVRVEVDAAMSQALRDQLQGRPTLEVASAPRAVVTSESLAPPRGLSQSGRGRSAGATQVATEAREGSAPAVPDRLPETVRRIAASPGLLTLEAGTFGQIGYARQVAARLGRLGARVDREREGRSERFTVRAGPFAGLAAADAALDQALRAGVTDARIIVE